MTRSRARALFLAVGFLPSLWASAQSPTWQDVSPTTATFLDIYSRGGTGGRVNGVAIDRNNPQVMYAASEWGGIYKSVDGGNAWWFLAGHRPMVTWDVEVSPVDSNRVYATSLYDGRTASQSGINVSGDGGLTWTRPLTAIPPPGFCANEADQAELSAFGIAIDRLNPQRVYIGTSCGLAISTDAGMTWHYESPPGDVHGGRLWDVVSAVPGVPDVCGDDGHFFFELATLQWTQGEGLDSGMCSIASSPYFPTPPNLFAIVGTKVFETTDRIHWTQTRTNPVAQGRIPFVETNKRSLPLGTFDLWMGDVLLWRTSCNANFAGNKCGEASNDCCTSASACSNASCRATVAALHDMSSCASNWSATCKSAALTQCTCDSPGWSAPMVNWGNGFGDQGALAFDPTVPADACPLLNSADAGVVVNDLDAPSDCQTPTWKLPTVTPRGLWPFSLSGVDVPGPDNDHVFLGTQDNGILGLFDAHAATPDWHFKTCCDVFDVLASPPTSTDDASLIFSFLSPAQVYRSNVDFSSMYALRLPVNQSTPGFTFPDAFSRFGEKSVAVIKDTGLYYTLNIEDPSPGWGNLGGWGCAVYTATNAQVFYVQNGNCNGESIYDQLWRWRGDLGWMQLFLPNGGGFGVVAVDPQNADRLLVSGLTDTDAAMYRSDDGGFTWQLLPALTNRMKGSGEFVMRSRRGPTNFTGMLGYHQPSLVAFDPYDSGNVIAGGRDSGIFFSKDGGTTWSLLTDPSNSHVSGTPHIPRPKHAYFSEADHNKSIYVSSQGRGVWRLSLCNADLYEPDDVSDMNTIQPGDMQQRSLCATGDRDLVSFTLTEPSRVLITTSGYEGSTRLRLLDGLGVMITEDFDGTPGLSRIERTCGAGTTLPAGDYIIEVLEFGQDDIIPAYDLHLTVTPCCADGFPPPVVEDLTMTSTMLEWSPPPNATGYDVVWGITDVLRETGGDFTAAIMDCIGDDTNNPTITHMSATPFPGECFFFLVRPTDCGTFDDPVPGRQVGLRDQEIEQVPLPCLP